MMSGSSTICRARIRGLSDEYGSWKTICIWRLASRSRRRENAEHVLAAKPHAARRRLDQPQHAAAGGRLSAARFADQPEGFARFDREAHVVHGLDERALAKDARVADEMLDEMRHLNEGHWMLGTRSSGSRLVARRGRVVQKHLAVWSGPTL